MNKKILSTITGIGLFGLFTFSSNDISAHSSKTYYINNYLYPTYTYSPASYNGYTYFITNARELNWVSYMVTLGNTFQGCTLEISNDIDFDGVDFIPIGTYYTHFQGIINGNGHKIKNLKINYSGYYGIGFVGYLGIYGIVRDLNVCCNCRFTGYGNVGGVVGCNAGLVEHCSSSADLFAVSDFVGGIVGYNDPSGIVRNCEACSLSTRKSGQNRRVGIFIGDNYGHSPINCRTFFFYPW